NLLIMELFAPQRALVIYERTN